MKGINISGQKRRLKINRVSHQRSYVSGRFAKFSEQNIQSQIIDGVRYYGSMRDLRTLQKIHLTDLKLY